MATISDESALTRAMLNALRENERLSAISGGSGAGTTRDAEFRAARAKFEQGLTGMTSALFSTERSLSKYNSTIDGAAGVMTSLVKLVPGIGKLGGAIGMVVTALAGLAKDAFAQEDAYRKAKDSLNQFGFTSELIAEDIAKMGRSAGYTSKELEKYTEIVTGLGSGALALGRTFGKGSTEFMKLTHVAFDLVAEFGTLGVNQEQLNKNQAHYIKLLSFTGFAMREDGESREKLKKASLEYTRNLLQLAAISGDDIETVKRKQEAAQADINFILGQNLKEQRITELRLKTGDKLAQKEADELRLEVDRNRAMLNVVTNLGFSGDNISKFAQVFQSKTFTDLTGWVIPSTFNNLLGLVKDVQSGRRSVQDFEWETIQYVKKITERYGPTALYSAEVARELGISSEMLQKIGTKFGMTRDQFDKDYAKRIQQTNKVDTDEVMIRRAKQELQEKAQRLAVDNFIDLVRGGLMKAVDMLQNALTWLTKKMLEGAKKIAEWTGRDTALLDKLLDSLTPMEELEDRLKSLTQIMSRPELIAYEARSLRLAQIEKTQLDLPMPASAATPQQRAALVEEMAKLNQEKERLKKEIFEFSRTKEGREIADFARRKKEYLDEIAKLQEQIQRKKQELSGVTSPGTTGARGSTGGGGASAAGTTGSTAAKPTTVADLQAILGAKYNQSGRVHVEGNAVDPRVLELAKELRNLESVTSITGINDNHPRRGTGHSEGRAVDFKILDEKNHAEVFAEMNRFLKLRFGDDITLINEYDPRNQSSYTTGPHFHAEFKKIPPQARFGLNPRRIQAATSGELVEVHNNELVAPLDPNSIIAKLLMASPSEADAIMGGKDNRNIDNLASSLERIALAQERTNDILYTIQGIDEETLLYTRTG